MFENKTSVLLAVPQEVVDRARVFAGSATTKFKRPVSLQMVLRALIDEGLKRDGDRAVLANVEEQLQAIRRIRSGMKGLRRRPVDAARRVGRRPSQARYMVASHLRSHDAAVATAERWIDDHLAEPITVRALSKAVAMSEKTFSRKVQAAIGMSPVKLIQRRRLMMATHLIETSKASIEEVAARVGYRDSTTLRRLIRRDLGTSPTGLR